MCPVQSPHDAFFKSVFSDPDNARSCCEQVLPPALLARLDLSDLELVPGSFVDPQLTELRTDLLFQAHHAEQPVLVYLLLEHQSTVDRRMPFRLLRYMVRIWEAWLAQDPQRDTLPIILPMVLHQGPGTWCGPTSLRDLLQVPAGTWAAFHDGRGQSYRESGQITRYAR